MNAPTTRDHSPWGAIQTVDQIGPDAVSVSTASHGGIWIAPEAVAKIPAPFRATAYNRAPWFEEDCDWSIPFAFLDLAQHFPEPRQSELRSAALDTLRNFHPDAFEALTGETCTPANSWQRKRQEVAA